MVYTRLAVALLCLLVAASAEAGSVFRRHITTADGVALAMYRYVPPGGGANKPPVLLVPDLGMGRRAFDVRGHGLAPYLRELGRDVFVVELRGHGASGAKGNWTLADIVASDLPAALAAIGALREGPVDIVAHGYAGTLVLAACAAELRGRVGRVVAIATPSHAEVPNRYAEALLSRGGRLSSLALDPDGAAILELLFTRHGEIPKRRYAALKAHAFFDLGAKASDELLEWMRTGDLRLEDGSTVLARLSRYDRPTLQLLGLRDNWVHPEASSTLRELAPGAKISVRLLSLLQYAGEDYTHLSLLQGAHAKDDVFAPIAQFLEGAQ